MKGALQQSRFVPPTVRRRDGGHKLIKELCQWEKTEEDCNQMNNRAVLRRKLLGRDWYRTRAQKQECSTFLE